MADRMALLDYAGRRFGLPDAMLLRLARDERLLTLPRLHGWVTGVALVDGEVAVGFDLGRWLDAPATGHASYQLYCRSTDVTLCLPVDHVAGIVSEAQGQWEPPDDREALPGCERVFVYRKLRYPLLDLEMMVRLLESN